MSTSIHAAPLAPPEARGWLQRIQEYIPEGRALPADIWRRRHRGIVLLLWGHIIALTAFALIRGYGLGHSLFEGALIAAPTLVAMAPFVWRRMRTAMSSLGLVIASAVLIHLSGGYIEMHFHFFVVVVIVSLYQDWITFFLAIGYVVVHHGIAGVTDPSLVYNHADAIAHPWKWAFIHGAFVLAASVASVVNWRQNEQARSVADLVLEGVSEGICGLDYQGRLLFVNAIGARLLGDLPERLIGRPLYDVITHVDPEGRAYSWQASPLARALRSGRISSEPGQRFVRRDGGQFPVEYAATPMSHRQGISGAVLTFRDLTERQQRQADQTRLQDQIIAMQQAQLRDLSTPIIPINERVVIVPLVGAIDSQRASHIMPALLAGVAQHKPRVAILDITGVPVVDREVAAALVTATQAVRLLGTEVVITGMRAEVAQALIGLDISLGGIATRRNLQEGIQHAMAA